MSASIWRPAATSRTISRPCRMCPISAPEGVYSAPAGPAASSRNFANVVQRGPGDDHVLIERRVEIVVEICILVGQVPGGSHYVQHVLQVAAQKRVVVPLCRRQHKQELSVLFVNVEHQLSQFDVLDPRFDQVHQFGEHFVRLEPRGRLAHQWIETIFVVAVFDGANFADVELGAVIRLPQHGLQPVKIAGRPLIAAFMGQRRIGPDRKAHLTACVSKRHAEVRFAVPGLQLLFFREQGEELAFLSKGTASYSNVKYIFSNGAAV